MGIFVIDKNDVVEYAKKAMEKESYIENFLETHIEVLDPGALVIGRQVPANGRKIDLMGIDRDGNAIIVELKRGKSPRDVISQALEYAVWAEGTEYNELNDIAKTKHLDENIDLYNQFQSKFNLVPERWNVNQTIYVVAERIDEKTKDVASYLNERGVDMRCVEIGFYNGAGKEIVSVNFVVGSPPATIDDATEKEVPAWNTVLDKADEENSSMVQDFIDVVEDKLKPNAGPQNKYYYMRVPDKAKKNLFGAIVCQKKSAYVSFRADPNTFQYDDNPEIKSGYRWFFTKDTERRITLTRSNFHFILRCLEHARDVTKEL